MSIPKDTQVYGREDFNSIKVLPGEGATPSTFNRGLIGSLDADSKLDQAIQFINRSTGIVATENTSFVAHFDGSLATSIVPIPYTVVGQQSGFLDSDGVYNGCFVSSKNDGNLLGSIAGLDTTLNSTKGWTISGNDIARCSVRSGVTGTRLRNYLRGGSSGIGTLLLTPATALDVSALANKSVSISLRLQTECDLDVNKVEVKVGFKQLDTNGALIIESADTFNSRSYNNIVNLENVTLDPTCTSIEPFVSVDFKVAGALIDLTVKNFMVANQAYSSSFTTSFNSGSGVTYDDCISTTEAEGTVLIRGKLNSLYASTASNPYGPLFLIDKAQGTALGLVVRGTSLRLEELKLSDMTVLQQSEAIVLANEDFGGYRLFAIRFGNDIGKIEGVFVDSNNLVHKVSIAYAETYKNKMLSVGLGAFNVGIATMEGPVTELRYDREWMNDQQLGTITVSEYPFVDKDEAQLTQDDIYAILDTVGANLLKNPDGRLWLHYWNSLPDESKFTNVIGNPIVGSGFTWIGGASGMQYLVDSDFMKIDPDQAVRLRGRMYSVAGTQGRFGIGLKYFSSQDNASAIGDMEVAYSQNEGSSDLYGIVSTPPTGDVYAKAYMVIEADFSSTGAFWTRLKLEQGDHFTMFTDDSSPKHALYAP